ncbi:hypothetical protein Q73_09255 [Bacillus coahuilensis m2-6]|uniref:Competence protein ComGF n=1 Tax=Bacillus coahuilensis p1.1.43 TaxID=1150625 RepID=A0A147K7A1_9BACI|nr:competence type IV pilus minor pilin ComGF [Bacillus coahuilensis]KUP05960.1 hypothetical protein Q75_09840 [Bacillus coahuilensis p1.1.43]KUP07393.1 hypothetical protein Q73_09255 [Bacillus coahuilensis m2-6]
MSASISNNHGFTLLETLVSFILFVMILQGLYLTLSSLHQIDTRLAVLPFEWSLFHQTLTNEVLQAESMNISPNKIEFIMDGQLVTYEKYGLNIRRKLNHKGHEIMLQRLESFTFQEIENGVTLTVHSQSGEFYSGNFYYVK